ncbi:hypothetical protein [Phytoactinopolyspora endophytica]|nr:hypothetical protein [Phytoactinopolyspora endophytica]
MTPTCEACAARFDGDGVDLAEARDRVAAALHDQLVSAVSR